MIGLSVFVLVIVVAIFTTDGRCVSVVIEGCLCALSVLSVLGFVVVAIGVVVCVLLVMSFAPVVDVKFVVVAMIGVVVVVCVCCCC